MAAFNPKHLTNPDIVRTIETKRLLALLKPYADYLRGRGLSLPSARQAATLDLELLAEILETPDEAAPQDLLNAIGYIDEMATPQGMDALLAAAMKAGMSYDATVDHSPADIAVQVWLFDPSIVEDQHAWYTWKSPRRMDCFQPEVGNRKDVLPVTPERVDRATGEMSDWFGGNNRSTFCKLSVRHIADRIQVSIQRGDPFQRKQAIEDDSVRNLHFRPAGKDTAIFKHGDHVLQCNSAIRRALPIYQRVFGILLFDDPEYFSDSNVFTLAPLEELGEDALSWGDIDDIEGILFTQYRVDRGGRNAYAIFGADDIIEDLRERGEALTIQGRLIDATFKIKFRGTRAWRTVKLYAGNAACYTRDGNADTAEQWLMLRQFIIRSGAKVEKEVDDKALRALEDAASLMEVAEVWQQRLGTEFEPLSRFFIATNKLASRVRFVGDSAQWKVIEYEDRVIALNEETFEHRVLQRSNALLRRIDVRLLAKEICESLGWSPKFEMLGRTYHVCRIGELPASLKAFPVYLCIRKYPTDVVRAIDEVARHASGPFLFVLPTNRSLDTAATVWLERTGGKIVSAADLLRLSDRSELVAQDDARSKLQRILGLEVTDSPRYQFKLIGSKHRFVAFDRRSKPGGPDCGRPGTETRGADIERLIIRLAGIIGVDPGPLTLRQLVQMAEAKRQHDWHIASSVMALTAEINRDRKRRRKPFKPDDFNPYTVTRSVPVKATVEQVAHLLGGRIPTQ